MKISIFTIAILACPVLCANLSHAATLTEAMRSISMPEKQKRLTIAQDVVYVSPLKTPGKSEIAINRPEFTDSSLVFSPDSMARFMQNIVFVSKRKNIYLLNIAENNFIQLAIGNQFHDEVSKLYVYGYRLYAITTDGKVFEGVFPPNGMLDYNILRVHTRDGEELKGSSDEAKPTLVYNQARDLFSELRAHSDVKAIVTNPKTKKLEVVHSHGKHEPLVGNG